MSQDKPVQVFFSYAHEDEDLRDELAKHLSSLERQGVIAAWYDRQILPGNEWADEIDENLDEAQIILLLVSSDFIASDYCYGIEMTQALERHKAGKARVIPIILRDVDWQGVPFSKLQALPKNAKPITSWDNQDEAFADVARGIRRAIRDFKEQTAPVEKPVSDAPKPISAKEIMLDEAAEQAEGEDKPSFSIKSIPMMIWVAFIGTLAIIIVAMIYFWGIHPGIQAKKTQTAEASLVAYATTETTTRTTTPVVTTARPTDTATASPPPGEPTTTEEESTPTDTPTPTDPPTTTPTGTPTPSVILQSPRHDDLISRKVHVVVAYENLKPGWTLHVIKQPLSKGLKKYPANYMNVEDPSGVWEIDVDFGQGQELADVEEYNIRVFVATKEETRSVLAEALDSGLDELPSGYQSPPTFVTRGKYEAQIIFPYVFGLRKVDINSVPTEREDINNLDDVEELFSTEQDQTTEKNKQPKVKLSPDGEKIAFISRTQDDLSAIYLKDLQHGGELLLIKTAPEEAIFESLAWSPDGDFIVYSVQSGSRWDLDLYDVPNSKIVHLTENLEDTKIRSDPNPSWIDSSTVIYTAQIETFGSSGFMKIDIHDKNPEIFFDDRENEQQGVISPDGIYIAYQVRSGEGNKDLEIYVADLVNRNSEPILLVGKVESPQFPSWDPNGGTIYYLSLAADPRSIYAVNIDGSNRRGIFIGTQGDRPVWNMDVGYRFIDE